MSIGPLVIVMNAPSADTMSTLFLLVTISAVSLSNGLQRALLVRPSLGHSFSQTALLLPPTSRHEYEQQSHNASPEPLPNTADRAWVSMVAFVHGGDWLVAYSLHGNVIVWDWRRSRVVKTIQVGPRHTHADAVPCFPALASDQKTLAVPQPTYRVDLWDLATSKLIRTLDLPPSARVPDQPPVSVAPPIVKWSPDGRTLAVYTWQELELWDASAGRLRHRLGQSSADGAAFTPSGRRMARFQDERVVLHDVATGRWLRVCGDVAAVGPPIAFSPDGELLAAEGDDPNWGPSERAPTEAMLARAMPIVVWDLRTGKRRRMGAYQSLDGGIVNLLFYSNRALLCRYRNGLDVWDAMRGIRLKRFPLRDFGSAMALGFDRHIVALVEGDAVVVRSLSDGRVLGRLVAQRSGPADASRYE